MSKERKAQIATLVLLLAAAGFVAVKKTGFKASATKMSSLIPAPAPKVDPTPQDAIYAMLDAARAGDVKKYLASYTGQMDAALKETLAETTNEAFAKYLKDSNVPLKGIAISEPQQLTDVSAKVRVEYVYQDRNEAQTMFVEKVSGVWKIARVESTERVKTLVPYGTPVN
jgi:hypothetical protein